MRIALATVAALVAIVAPVGAQVADSAVVLPDLAVTVTRSGDSLRRVGAAITVVEGAAVRRGRLATGLDESLAFVPGVVLGNRWNHSLDQRLSIRGFGSRANFGLRGVKVLLDGVPQTLPDGQSQLTNLDLALVDRVEVLRGAASSTQGNAAGGVIAFSSRVVPVAPWELDVSTEHGSFGTSRTQVVGAARSGDVGGTIALSRFASDGFRLHSAVEQRRLSAALDWGATDRVMVSLRAAVADDPSAENPGALTAPELAARRDSASAGNILRGADKAVTQRQLSIGVRGGDDRFTWTVTAYGLQRDLDNPLATPPPQPAGPDEGTHVAIDRKVGGIRASGTVALGAATGAPRLTVGADAQLMRDERENRRSVAGTATADLLVAQREDVRELGPFLQLAVPIGKAVQLRGGVRYDRVRFAVADRRIDDGDASGARTMSAASGHVALAFSPSASLTAWASVATAFETPTTTELANRVEGDGGFNGSLDPQRSTSVEAGARWRRGALQAEAAIYRTGTRDALIAFRENAGRTYFRNAGRTRTAGAEAAVTYTPVPGLSLLATWTHTAAVFTDYQVIEGDVGVSLNGNRLAGIPRHVARIGIQGTIGAGFAVDLDHAWSSSMFADDRNLVEVDGWGSGVTGARIRWAGRYGRHAVAPFVAATNLLDREYVGSVTINGGFGRVFEPAAGRAIYIGLAVGTGG